MTDFTYNTYYRVNKVNQSKFDKEIKSTNHILHDAGIS